MKMIPARKIPGTHFCLRLSRTQGHSVAGRIRLIEKKNPPHRDSNLRPRARSIVPQPSTLPRNYEPSIKQMYHGAHNTHAT
jgi:hypothetical protein